LSKVRVSVYLVRKKEVNFILSYYTNLSHTGQKKFTSFFRIVYKWPLGILSRKFDRVWRVWLFFCMHVFLKREGARERAFFLPSPEFAAIQRRFSQSELQNILFQYYCKRQWCKLAPLRSGHGAERSWAIFFSFGAELQEIILDWSGAELRKLFLVWSGAEWSSKYFFRPERSGAELQVFFGVGAERSGAPRSFWQLERSYTIKFFFH